MRTVSESVRGAFGGAYAGRQVLVTGHTGFKGAWLCEWLLTLGAEVTGYSLPPDTTPSLFEQLGLEGRVRHLVGDVRDIDSLRRAVSEAQPDFVFHLAAQSLVRRSYRQPVETYATNVLGTIHLLEALRPLAKPCAAVCVTSDKCYQNRQWDYGYREDDPLGGADPYSSSKAAAEVAIAAWRQSFFGGHPVRIASARAGNVIGGGDWAPDRIVPDCIRAVQQDQPIGVRNPRAIRPWQHVLEPLSGYLWLGALLANPPAVTVPLHPMCSPFNFGPRPEANRSVADIVEEVLRQWPGRWVDQSEAQALPEAKLLRLSIDKAWGLLAWHPVWSFAEAVAQTVSWYRQVDSAAETSVAQELTVEQIVRYTEEARQLAVLWAIGPLRP